MSITSQSVIDPVCDMSISPQTAMTLPWEGRTYYFCEAACRDTFRDDPARWTEPIHHEDEAGA